MHNVYHCCTQGEENNHSHFCNAGDIATSNHDFIKVTEPYEIFKVPEDADEDERKNLKFAAKQIPNYNPLAGYAYYEFTQCAFILPERNVMALKMTLCNTISLRCILIPI